MRTWSFNEAQDKAARDPPLAAIGREEARLAAAEAELETAKKLHEEALGAAPAAGGASVASLDEAKTSAEQAKKDATEAKQAEKDADAAVKAATKASVDAKASEKKDADQHKKLQMNVEALQRKAKDISSGMALTDARAKIIKLDKLNEEKKAKFDKATEHLAAAMAKMEDWKQQVAHCKAEKLRFCRDARAPEMEEIVQNMKATRDELLHELEDCEAQYAVIAKLRADRITLFGAAEIDRRVKVQSKIIDLKNAEHSRCDQLQRICYVCGKEAGNAFQCEKHICVWATDKAGHIVYVKPTFRCPGANYVSISAPSLDGCFWGTDWEKKSDAELMNYPFKEDIATNPYSMFWAGFHGAYYYVNGKHVNRDAQREDNDTPTADEAFAKLPAHLKPTPAMTAIAEGLRSIFDNREYAHRGSDATRRQFVRDALQHGAVSKRGDRFDFMMHHSWYSHHAVTAFCRENGIDPQTRNKL